VRCQPPSILLRARVRSPHDPVDDQTYREEADMSDTTPINGDDSLEGPDVETEAADGDATKKPGGLGGDGTIPNDPDGVGAGHTGTASTFEPEEDEDA
jgi:hypothetical protein